MSFRSRSFRRSLPSLAHIALSRRSLNTTTSSRPPSSSSSSSSLPPSRFFTTSTLYPFLLLSLITSLAINLSSSRTLHSTQVAHLQAQLSVLERILLRIQQHERGWFGLTEEEKERIEKELRSVGLAEPREGEVVVLDEGIGGKGTSWWEVLFGKKGERYQGKKDDTDWEKVFRDADEEENRRNAVNAAGKMVAKSSTTSPTTTTTEPMLVTPAVTTLAGQEKHDMPPSERPGRSKPAIYL